MLCDRGIGPRKKGIRANNCTASSLQKLKTNYNGMEEKENAVECSERRR